MSKENPTVWKHTTRRSHGIVASVKVEYRTQRGTTVTATRTARSSDEAESELHKRMERVAKNDIRATVCKEQLTHD